MVHYYRAVQTIGRWEGIRHPLTTLSRDFVLLSQSDPMMVSTPRNTPLPTGSLQPEGHVLENKASLRIESVDKHYHVSTCDICLGKTFSSLTATSKDLAVKASALLPALFALVSCFYKKISNDVEYTFLVL